MKKVILITAVIASMLALFGTASAQSNFYEGKTIRIVVGFSPGGGYDALARMLSRHMPKYIPGNPTIVVDNMTGAGSLLAANHIFNVAKPDGLTFGHFSGGFAFNQVMGQPGIEFDARKFVFVGAVARDESAIALTKASGVSNMEQWMAVKTPVKMGTTGPGAFGTDNVIKVIKAALNRPIKIISGYKGTAEMRSPPKPVRSMARRGVGIRCAGRGRRPSNQARCLSCCRPYPNHFQIYRACHWRSISPRRLKRAS